MPKKKNWVIQIFYLSNLVMIRWENRFGQNINNKRTWPEQILSIVFEPTEPGK